MTQVFAAIKDSIETFNRLHREAPRPPVEFSVFSNPITMSMLLPASNAVELHVRKQAEGIVEFDQARYLFSATFKESGAPLVVLHLDADAESNVVILDEARLTVADADAASRILLEKFLMALASA